MLQTKTTTQAQSIVPVIEQHVATIKATKTFFDPLIAKKVYYSESQELELFFDENVIYKIDKQQVPFEIFTNFKKESPLLYIFGQAAISHAKRKKYGLPMFNRWSWLNNFPHSIMILNDPTLYVADLRVGWFQGTKDVYYLPIACEIIQEFVDKLSLRSNNITFVGASAGGFTSLMMAGYFPDSSAIVENAQTDIRKYYKSHIEELLNTCFYIMSLEEASSEEFDSRFSIIEHYRKTKNIPNIYYIQNMADTFHLQNHFIPFTNELAQIPRENSQCENTCLFTELYYNQQLGHEPLPKKDFMRRLNRGKYLFSKTLN